MSDSYKPINVGLVAKQIAKRLEGFSSKLSTEIQHKCSKCEDIGLIKKDGGYGPCECRNQKPEHRQKFFD